METMDQVQWLKIRKAEITELVRCDSMASTPTAGRQDVERNTTSIKILFLLYTYRLVSQMPVHILGIPI